MTSDTSSLQPRTSGGYQPAPTVDAIFFYGQFLRQGHQGPAVADLQRLLGLFPDGIFGPGTRAAVEDFQRSVQLAPNSDALGLAGKTTLRTLVSVKRQWFGAPTLDEVHSGERLFWEGQAGPAIKQLQHLLRISPVMVDGAFGPGTYRAVLEFQRSAGLPSQPGMEGIVGRTLLEALLRRQTAT